MAAFHTHTLQHRHPLSSSPASSPRAAPRLPTRRRASASLASVRGSPILLQLPRARAPRPVTTAHHHARSARERRFPASPSRDSRPRVSPPRAASASSASPPPFVSPRSFPSLGRSRASASTHRTRAPRAFHPSPSRRVASAFRPSSPIVPARDRVIESTSAPRRRRRAFRARVARARAHTVDDVRAVRSRALFSRARVAVCRIVSAIGARAARVSRQIRVDDVCVLWYKHDAVYVLDFDVPFIALTSSDSSRGTLRVWGVDAGFGARAPGGGDASTHSTTRRHGSRARPRARARVAMLRERVRARAVVRATMRRARGADRRARKERTRRRDRDARERGDER